MAGPAAALMRLRRRTSARSLLLELPVTARVAVVCGDPDGLLAEREGDALESTVGTLEQVACAV